MTHWLSFSSFISVAWSAWIVTAAKSFSILMDSQLDFFGLWLDIVDTSKILIALVLGHLFAFIDIVGWHSIEPTIRRNQFILFSLWFSASSSRVSSWLFLLLLKMNLERIKISLNRFNRFFFLLFFLNYFFSILSRILKILIILIIFLRISKMNLIINFILELIIFFFIKWIKTLWLMMYISL